MNLRDIHECEQSEGKIVNIEMDKLGNTWCGYCHKKVDYSQLLNRPAWAVQQIFRASGLLEDVCKHGVGHPNKRFLESHPGYVKAGYDIHGCDGCCSDKKKEIHK